MTWTLDVPVIVSVNIASTEYPLLGWLELVIRVLNGTPVMVVGTRGKDAADHVTGVLANGNGIVIGLEELKAVGGLKLGTLTVPVNVSDITALVVMPVISCNWYPFIGYEILSQH